MLTLVMQFFVQFALNAWGVLNEPYATYRKFVTHSQALVVVPLFILITGYFLLISPWHVHSIHPFLLTYNFGELISGVFFTYLLIVIGMYVVGKLLKGSGTLEQVMVTWGFSLLPTLCWF